MVRYTRIQGCTKQARLLLSSEVNHMINKETKKVSSDCAAL